MKSRVLITMILLMATVSTVQAQTHLSGFLSGTLEAGEYLVDSTIVVASGETLTIQPGAHLQFTAWYPFEILGTLIAEGTEEDSIIFDCDTQTNPEGWHGLRFNGEGASDSYLAYSRISFGQALSYWPLSCGGGIFCMSTSPTFSHCLITSNSAAMYGGGIYCYNAPVTLEECTITNNSASSQGGGMYASLSPISINQSTFNYNTAGTGGGMVVISSQMELSNSVITHNTASTTGGIHCSGNPSPIIEKCIISYNSSTGT